MESLSRHVLLVFYHLNTKISFYMIIYYLQSTQSIFVSYFILTVVYEKD